MLQHIVQALCTHQHGKYMLQVVDLNQFYNSAYGEPAGIFEVINNSVEGIFQKKTQEHNLIQYQQRFNFYYKSSINTPNTD